jgi:hypothetical protein
MITFQTRLAQRTIERSIAEAPAQSEHGRYMSVAVVLDFAVRDAIIHLQSALQNTPVNAKGRPSMILALQKLGGVGS